MDLEATAGRRTDRGKKPGRQGEGQVNRMRQRDMKGTRDSKIACLLPVETGTEIEADKVRLSATAGKRTDGSKKSDRQDERQRQRDRKGPRDN